MKCPERMKKTLDWSGVPVRDMTKTITSVTMYLDEWVKLRDLLETTLDALDPKGSDYSEFKGIIGHIENQTSLGAGQKGDG